MTLRLRFNLLITLIMLFLIIALAAITMSSSKRSIQEGVESANKVTLQYLETIIARSVQNPEWGNTHDVVRRFLRQLGYVRSNDIFLYNNHIAEIINYNLHFHNLHAYQKAHHIDDNY